MLLSIIGLAFLIPVVYVIIGVVNEKRAYKRKLESIQQRLAEKKNEK